MTRRAEPACLAGKHQQALFPAVGTPDAGKPAHRIAAVEILLYHLLDYRTEVPVLLLETILIFPEEPFSSIPSELVRITSFIRRKT
jgi:hypothetical protein